MEASEALGTHWSLPLKCQSREPSTSLAYRWRGTVHISDTHPRCRRYRRSKRIQRCLTRPSSASICFAVGGGVKRIITQPSSALIFFWEGGHVKRFHFSAVKRSLCFGVCGGIKRLIFLSVKRLHLLWCSDALDTPGGGGGTGPFPRLLATAPSPAATVSLPSLSPAIAPLKSATEPGVKGI